jgi:hypothetical protein
MAPDEATISRLLADPAWTKLVAKEGEPLWTDDFSNLLPVISNGGPARPR